jgi:ribosomal protein S6--L-glutamate ligase
MKHGRMGTKLHFLVSRASGASPVVIDATWVLERHGFEVESTVLEEELLRSDLLDGGDRLWVVESSSELALATAAVFHARGARMLNPYPATIAARNKIIASRVLAAAGVPAPRTWVTGDLGLLRPLLRDHPLVVRPHLGWRREGVTIVRDERALAALPEPTSPVVVQELLPWTGEELRLSIAGDEVFGTRTSPAREGAAATIRPAAVAPEMRELALRCGRAFGLALYALDVLETPSGPYVVDVTGFPGYEECDGAAAAVAHTIEAYATGTLDLGRLAESVTARLAPALARPQPDPPPRRLH